MMKRKTHHGILVLLFLIGITSCTDPYKLQTNTFEDAIVIEATITNEVRHQKIKLSRTYRLEESGPTPETGAHIFIVDDQDFNYEFEEENGEYVSAVAFQALPDRQYQMSVTTSDGTNYKSSWEKLTTAGNIESVTATAGTNELVDGIQISLNSFDPTGTSKYYRFEYEETYKRVVPYWSEYKAVVLGPKLIGRELRVGETRTCFLSGQSNQLLLTNTSGFSEDRVTNFPIRFIDKTEDITNNRYSILVRQYVLSLASYTYYETLASLSGSESILSQNQPGFFSGNIRSTTHPNEKVIGFFDVSSVASQRIYFNFNDVYPDEILPPYFSACELITLDRTNFCYFPQDLCPDGPRLESYINTNYVVYYESDQAGILYTMVTPACGDCTTFGSNVVPSFWTD